MQNKIKVFENKQVRTLWNADEEEWYFSVVDIVSVLTDNDYDILNFLNFDRDDTKKPRGYDYQGKNAKRRYKYIATAMEASIAAVYLENGENEVIEIVKQWIEWIDESKS